MDILAALCDIRDLAPNDLIEITRVNAQVAKTGTDHGPLSRPSARRTTIRRPEGL